MLNIEFSLTIQKALLLLLVFGCFGFLFSFLDGQLFFVSLSAIVSIYALRNHGAAVTLNDFSVFFDIETPFEALRGRGCGPKVPGILGVRVARTMGDV